MKVYLVQRLIDECAWITEEVCTSKVIAEREMEKLEKYFNKKRNIRVKLGIDIRKVVEK